MRVVTVFGAPGSGKTTEIINRFNSAISQGLEPDQILVLTGSREAANDLRDQLAIALQRATPSSLARTITSFAFGVLRIRAIQNQDPLPELISGSEQDRILAEVLQSHIQQNIDNQIWPKHINKSVLELNGFRAELRDLITVALEHGISANELEQLGIKWNKPEWQASAQLFNEYVTRVESVMSRYDASQLLRAANDWLSNLDEWPDAIAKIKLILVDDAQELTPAASTLLKVLTQRGADLVLVGDPDSSTLGFRSADPRAMTNLANQIVASKNGQHEEIFLQPTHAIRTPAISHVLSRINSQIDTARAGRQRKGLNPLAALVEQDKLGVEGKIFNQQQSEIAWLARRLRELHLYEKISWDEMAVVARSRNQLEQLASLLSHESVPVQLVGAQSALRDEFASRMLLKISEQVLWINKLEIQTALDFLTSPLCGLDSLGIRRLRRALRREELLADGTRNSDELILALFDAEGSAVTLKTQEGKKVSTFLKSYFQGIKLAANSNTSAEDLLWHFWDSSKLVHSWQVQARGVGEVATQANRNLDAVVELFAAANRFAERNPGADPRIFIEQQLALGLPEDSLALNDLYAQAISLATPSSLISKRYKVVALPQLLEGVWPNLRPRSSLLGATALDALLSGRIDEPNTLHRSELPDELRMLYKSVGAASEHLLISATDSEDNQVSQFIGLTLGEVPPAAAFERERLTLRGLSGSLRRTLAIATEKEVIDSAALGLARLADAGVAGAHPQSWYGMLPLSTIEPLVDLQEGSVTLRPSQLENFVKCPLHWFLNAHGGGDKTFSANLGSLVHKALELGTDLNEEKLWNLVESKWHTLNFESDWLEQAGQRKAKKMLSNMVQYMRAFEADGAKVIGKEVSFEFDLGKAHVRGQVDRLELYPDGRVMIVDLKTGSGTFSAEQARNHAQLGLYQLAFQNGAFKDLNIPADVHLGGAKLLLVSGNKPTEREQPSLEDSASAKEQFEMMVQNAITGMAMSDRIFIAQVGNHCTKENEFGTCELHLTKAVSYVG